MFRLNHDCTVIWSASRVVPGPRECGYEEGIDTPGLMAYFVAGDKAHDFNRMSRQPDVRRLVDEFGIEVYQQYDKGKTIFVDFKNKVHK